MTAPSSGYEFIHKRNYKTISMRGRDTSEMIKHIKEFVGVEGKIEEVSVYWKNPNRSV